MENRNPGPGNIPPHGAETGERAPHPAFPVYGEAGQAAVAGGVDPTLVAPPTGEVQSAEPGAERVIFGGLRARLAARGERRRERMESDTYGTQGNRVARIRHNQNVIEDTADRFSDTVPEDRVGQVAVFYGGEHAHGDPDPTFSKWDKKKGKYVDQFDDEELAAARRKNHRISEDGMYVPDPKQVYREPSDPSLEWSTSRHGRTHTRKAGRRAMRTRRLLAENDTLRFTTSELGEPGTEEFEEAVRTAPNKSRADRRVLRKRAKTATKNDAERAKVEEKLRKHADGRGRPHISADVRVAAAKIARPRKYRDEPWRRPEAEEAEPAAAPTPERTHPAERPRQTLVDTDDYEQLLGQAERWGEQAVGFDLAANAQETFRGLGHRDGQRPALRAIISPGEVASGQLDRASRQRLAQQRHIASMFGFDVGPVEINPGTRTAGSRVETPREVPERPIYDMRSNVYRDSEGRVLSPEEADARTVANYIADHEEVFGRPDIFGTLAADFVRQATDTGQIVLGAEQSADDALGKQALARQFARTLGFNITARQRDSASGATILTVQRRQTTS